MPTDNWHDRVRLLGIQYDLETLRNANRRGNCDRDIRVLSEKAAQLRMRLSGNAAMRPVHVRVALHYGDVTRTVIVEDMDEANALWGRWANKFHGGGAVMVRHDKGGSIAR